MHAGVLNGTVGCGFGAYAAKQNHIAYCPAPQLNDPTSMEAYGKAIAGFGLGEKTILMAIPSEDPPTYEEGHAYAYQLYAATLHSACMANRSMIRQLLQFSMPADAVEQLVYMDREQQMRMAHGPTWINRPQNQALMDSMFMIEGPAALTVLHAQTGSLRKLMAFVMAPYYEPINGVSHPRYSPHFALVLNYTADVIDANERMPRQVDAVRAWTNAAVGYRYKQGFHIPQIPVPRDEMKDVWNPKD